MNTYKITNITNLLGKRDNKFNTKIIIEYIDNRRKKYINLNAGDTAYLTIDSLPLSAHKLRIKNLIIVIKVNASDIPKLNKVVVEKPVEPKKEPKTIISKKEPKTVVYTKKTIKNNKTVEKQTSMK